MENIDNANIRSMEDQYTSGVYTKRPVAIVRGSGARLWDADGRQYIDCVGGQGAANLGHANPAVAQAIADQAVTLISCPEMFYNDRRAELGVAEDGEPRGRELSERLRERDRGEPGQPRRAERARSPDESAQRGGDADGDEREGHDRGRHERTVPHH